MEEERSASRKGCIRTSKGPWKVRRPTKDGKTVTKLRYPSERERQNNRERERKRRTLTHNIFAGLRAHGNFDLPKHADTNDILMALCQQAGWDVKKDGTLSRKKISPAETTPLSLEIVDLTGQVSMGLEDEEEGYCNCDQHYPTEECYVGQQIGQIVVSNINIPSPINVDLSLSL